jgi:hypothetical protein
MSRGNTSISEPLLSFEIWERGECPVCGSDDIEYDLMYDCMACDKCGAFSAEILMDDMELETYLINDLDRFDYLEIFEKDRVGGDS